MNGEGQVSTRGEWPGLVTLRAGWWKGVARPRHDHTLDAVLRLERSSSDFVRRCTTWLADHGAATVDSPPLMHGSARVFQQAGFSPYAELLLFERDLRDRLPTPADVRDATEGDRIAAARIDDAAFDGDWRVGRLGLADALDATPHSVMLFHGSGAGFVIAGVSHEIGYLQRIAVDPSHQGQGYGRALVQAAMAWARSRGARTMMLNTQIDNERATQMYRSESFVALPSRLVIHRHQA
ncbi:MAG TPA: GNAT family N-acetyltransferase [Acidimicrobiia bacterium]|nr:GNAT family N-acetyltransferase [Acidimicrobiia bacterium]